MAKVINDALPAYNDTWAIGSIGPNRKVAKSVAYRAYGVMTPGMTIAEYKVALGTLKKCRLEIAWNFARGFITLVDPAGKVYGELAATPVETPVDAE